MPRPFTTAIIAMEMPAPISPYSMAVISQKSDHHIHDPTSTDQCLKKKKTDCFGMRDIR